MKDLNYFILRAKSLQLLRSFLRLSNDKDYRRYILEEFRKNTKVKEKEKIVFLHSLASTEYKKLSRSFNIAISNRK